MKIKEVTDFLASAFPLSLQEDYDNCGLQIGNLRNEIKGVLVALDCTEKVIAEALLHQCNLIIVHHPLLFKGLKCIGVESEIERIIHSCIKNDLCIYALHTNIDNHNEGVNAKIAEKMGLLNPEILLPKKNVLYKLQVLVPSNNLLEVQEAISNAGGGKIGNYSACSFASEGIGTFTPNEKANPSIGQKGMKETVQESKLEFLLESYLLDTALAAMKKAHPYEEIAYDVIPLVNEHQQIGSGMIGKLKDPMDENSFLLHLKNTFQCEGIRHTALLNKKIETVAFCGGAGSFLVDSALRQKADVFVSADFKYHDFFNTNESILIVDIGHYESEQFTSSLIVNKIKTQFNTFDCRITEINTNPIHYFK